MRMIEWSRPAWPALLCLSLSACGGGDGGAGVNSTPTAASSPSPTFNTPASLSPSTAFSNTMQSGNFATVAASEVFTATVNGASTSYAHDYTSTANAYISYDAASNTYTFNYTGTGGGATYASLKNLSNPQTTVVANGTPDPTEVKYSNFVCYTSGCYSGSTVVTHTGAGPFVYTYTAFAQTSSTSQSILGGGGTTTYSAVFGFATPDAAVPRTGSATYALDLMGTAVGTGTGTVNFAGNSYNFSGTVNGGGSFSSTGTLSSTANRFSGPISVTVGTTQTGTVYQGQLGGMFFGPQAQELGATFVAPAVSTSGATPAQGTAGFSGAILGHK